MVCCLPRFLKERGIYQFLHHSLNYWVKIGKKIFLSNKNTFIYIKKFLFSTKMQRIFILIFLATIFTSPFSNCSTTELPLIVLMKEVASSIDPDAWNKLTQKLNAFGYNTKFCSPPLVFDVKTLKCKAPTRMYF